MIWLWITHLMGVDYGVPYGHWVWYSFWSGFGSLALVSSPIIMMWRHLNCHDPSDWWRIGRYPVAGGAYRVCRRHHPDPSIREHGVTREHIRAAHERHIHPLHIISREPGTDHRAPELQWAGNDLRLMMEGEDVVAEGNGAGTYRGRHERLKMADPKLIDVDAILEEGRQALLAWEMATEGSATERRAGMRVGEVFATLDAEARRGNLPVDWRPPAHATWTEHQRGLAVLWGTCHCGGPRNVKYVTDGAAIKGVTYCTICGDEPS